MLQDEERKEYFEALSAEKDLALSACRLNSSDSYLVLREPDPVEQFEYWKHWLEWLETVHNILVS